MRLAMENPPVDLEDASGEILDVGVTFMHATVVTSLEGICSTEYYKRKRPRR